MEDGNKFVLEDYIDIRELFDVLWKDKILIILITVLFAVSSVFYSLSLTDIYRSSAILTLSDDSNSGQNLASKYSGLASLAGINIGSGSSDKSDWAIEKIKSRDFLLGLINDNQDLVLGLMAAGSFNEETGELSLNQDKYEPQKEIWLIEEPHYQDIWSSYSNRLYISKSKDTGFISISFDHLSPIFAKETLDLIIKSINDVAKQADIKESNQAFNYLMGLSPSIKNANVKDSLNKVIEEQLRVKMFSNIKSNYLFKMIEPPFVPQYKFKPSRSIICIIGTFIGGLIGIFIALFRRYFLQ